MIVLKPEATADLAATSIWYEAKRTGLGVDFLLEVERTFQRVDERPAGYPKAHGDLRRAVVRRFPYTVYYRTDGQGGVAVYAVMHHRRSPVAWQERFQP